MSEQRDSTLVSVGRTSVLGQDKSGRDVTLLAFSPEEAQKLAEAIQQRTGDVGLLVRLATEIRTTKDGSRQFPSSFLMLMPDQPKEARGGYQKKSTFTPKTYGNPKGQPVAAPAKATGGYSKPYGKPQTRINED